MHLVAVLLIAMALMCGNASAQTAESPKTIKQNTDGTIALLAIDATIEGTRARVEKKGENPHNIGYWTDGKDKAVWKLEVVKPGKYEVEVEYSLDRRSEGSEYTIEFGGKAVEVKPKVTGTWLDFTKTKVGTVELTEAATIRVVVKPTKKPGQAVLDLRAIRLTPA